MASVRRAREQRAMYARNPDPGGLRVNNPNGFPSQFLPIPTPGDATDVVGRNAAWWYGSDVTGGRTTGSPLTEPEHTVPPLAYGSILPAVTRCLKTLVDAVVRTRWVFRDSSGRSVDRPLWVGDPMLLGGSPGPIFALQPAGARVDAMTFWGTLLADAVLWGRGAFTYIEGSDRAPIPGSLCLLNPFMVGLDTDQHIVLDPWGKAPVRTDHDGRFTVDGDTWRVVLLAGDYPSHPGWPQGVLLRHFNTFKLGARLEGYMDGMFTSGVPSGYLSVSTPNFGRDKAPDPDNPTGPPVPEDVALRRSWMQAHGDGRRSVAVLNAMVTYTPLALSPVETDLAKVSATNRVDIAHAFGMSSVWLDEGMSGLNYSNSSERRADLVNLTAAGWGLKITNLVASLLPFGWTVSVNWPEFVSASIESASPSLVATTGAGITTATEARSLLGLTPWLMPDPDFTDTSKAAGGGPTPSPPPAPPAPEEVPANE